MRFTNGKKICIKKIFEVNRKCDDAYFVFEGSQIKFMIDVWSNGLSFSVAYREPNQGDLLRKGF